MWRSYEAIKLPYIQCGSFRALAWHKDAEKLLRHLVKTGSDTIQTPSYCEDGHYYKKFLKLNS